MKPKPGQFYTAITGDTWPKIAAKAYGLEELWPQIKDANQQILLVDCCSEVKAGEVVYIPEDQTNVELDNLLGRT